MKKLLSLALLGMFGVGAAGIVGCSADSDDHDHATYKKTTVHDNGDTRTTKTETHKETTY